MRNDKHVYIAIDLKSFYASVECVKRSLNPLTTNLVVADVYKSEKTICLAVTPSLKQYGISGRARLFQVIQKVKEINLERKKKAPGQSFVGESYDSEELERNPGLSLTYIAAPPRMASYMQSSTRIHEIYLKYVSTEDIHVYSIDEVFMDVSSYLKTYGISARELAKRIITDILTTTGITATAGIGTNLYLCKVAMDIVAKHIKADEDGVRIAQLDEMRFRKLLWDHKPITDFWRIGSGYAKKLEQIGLYTMGDIAKCSMGKTEDYYNEELLYQLFGIHAELLIDHAWGYESCTMEDIKTYRPAQNSLGSGQVLSVPYDFDKAKLIVKEMLDLLSLSMVEKGVVCDQMVLTVAYDRENIAYRAQHVETIKTDHYGRKVPKHAHGTVNLERMTSSSKLITEAVLKLYDRIVNRHLTIRKVSICANHVVGEDTLRQANTYGQLDLFADYDKENIARQLEKEALEKEKQLQLTTLKIKQKYGKNAVIKGMNLEDGAKTIERNGTIGGHKA